MKSSLFTYEISNDEELDEVDFTYSKVHEFINITEEILVYLLKQNLCIELYAIPSRETKNIDQI